MNNLLSISEVLTSFVEVYICFDILKCIFKNKKAEYAMFFCLIYLILIMLLNSISIFSNFTLIFFTIFITVLSGVIVEGRLKERFIVIITYILFIGMIDMLFICFISIVTCDVNYIFKIVGENNTSRIIYILSVKLFLIIIYLLIRNKLKLINIFFINYKPYVFSIIIYMILQQFIAVILISNDINGMKLGLCISWLVFILIIALIIFQGTKIGSMLKEAEQNRFIDLLNKDLEKRIKQTDLLYKENAKKLHEFNHHISILKVMADENNCDSIKEYLKQIVNNYEYVKTIFTGNETLDIILNVKKIEANNKGIDFITNINFPSFKAVTDSDLCSILSNIIDNAIESCEKCSEKGAIDLRIKYNNNTIIIKQINNTQNDPFKTNFKSNKGLNHGIGLKIVENIVKKYNGTVIYDYENGKFITSILIFSST